MSIKLFCEKTKKTISCIQGVTSQTFALLNTSDFSKKIFNTKTK